MTLQLSWKDSSFLASASCALHAIQGMPGINHYHLLVFCTFCEEKKIVTVRYTNSETNFSAIEEYRFADIAFSDISELVEALRNCINIAIKTSSLIDTVISKTDIVEYLEPREKGSNHMSPALKLSKNYKVIPVASEPIHSHTRTGELKYFGVSPEEIAREEEFERRNSGKKDAFDLDEEPADNHSELRNIVLNILETTSLDNLLTAIYSIITSETTRKGLGIYLSESEAEEILSGIMRLNKTCKELLKN